MTKEELKKYINEAVDAMTTQEIEKLFPVSNQPDLFTIAKEITGLRGEMRKLSQTSLKINNSIKGFAETNSLRFETISDFLEEQDEKQKEEKEEELDKALKLILFQLTEQDDLLATTYEHFKDLPKLSLTGFRKYKQQIIAWRKGYEITMKQWTKFFKSSGLHKTGNKGQLFDPQLHEAVSIKNDPNKPNNIILETEVQGVLFRNKLVRYAKVIVNKTDKTQNITKITKRDPKDIEKSKQKRRKRKKRKR